MSHFLRLCVLRVLVVLGYLPNMAIYWLAGGSTWRQQFHDTARSMWHGE